ncbi:MAG: hypothetical protein AB7T06_18715, partial [Kofleriaceae bacterium]
MKRALALLVTAACGRIGFEPAETPDGPEATPFSIDLGAPSALRGVALLPDGAVAVTGQFAAPVTFGGIPLAHAGDGDIVLAVVEPTGVVRWAKAFGSSGFDDSWDVLADPDGSIFITGAIGGAISFGGSVLVPSVEDVFVASFTADGTHRWSVRFPGQGAPAPDLAQVGFRLATFQNGDIAVGGRVAGAVDLGLGVLAETGAAWNAFVVRLDRASGATRWAGRADGAGASEVFGIAIDANDQVFVVGDYQPGADLGSGAAEPSRGGADVFVMALDSAGDYVGHDTFGGPGEEWAFGAAIVGDVLFVSGYYDGPLDFTSTVPLPAGGKDAFVAGYSLDGDRRDIDVFGGSGCDHVFAIEPAGAGLVFGGAYSGTIDLGDGLRTSRGGADAFVSVADVTTKAIET